MAPATHRLSRWLRVNDGGLAPGVPFDTLRARGYVTPARPGRRRRAGLPAGHPCQRAGIAAGGPVR